MANQAGSLTDSNAGGTDYGGIDPTKIDAQTIARTTSHYAELFGGKVVEWTRGESVFLIEFDDFYLAFVIEGLGTKNLVADAMWHVLGKPFYDKCGQDAVAMILNDMITLGAMPIVIGQYLAAGDTTWFDNQQRRTSLLTGWTNACHEAQTVYGPGETPVLSGIINPATIDLAGAAMGMLKPKSHLMNPAAITAGDAIVMLAGNGVHANGLTGLRKLADLISYHEPMEDGRMFGEAVLDPTPIYVPAIRGLLDSGITPHYAINITGHGWRKLMRAERAFTYRITTAWKIPPIFDFIRQHTKASWYDMFAGFNMGPGFALIVDAEDAHFTVDALHKAGCHSWIAGQVDLGPKQVIIEPYGVTFTAESMNLR